MLQFLRTSYKKLLPSIQNCTLQFSPMKNEQTEQKMSSLFARSECNFFTYCYCEENVWKLCELAVLNKMPQLKDLYAVWFTNKDERVPMWHQSDVDTLSLWDYHVILVHHENQCMYFYFSD